MKTFSKILFTPISGPKRFCIWLTFKLIQKYIYPTKALWIPSVAYTTYSQMQCHSQPPSLQNPGYASGSLLVRIVDFLIFLSSPVLFSTKFSEI